MKNLLDLPKSSFILPTQKAYSSDDLVYVDMYQAAVTSPEVAGPRVLFTSALTTCCAVAVYNPRNAVTGLTHLVAHHENPRKMALESEVGLRIMMQIVGTVKKDDFDPLEVRIVGPHIGGKLMLPFLDKVIAVLREFDVRILSFDIDGKGPSCVGVDPERWNLGLIRGGMDACDYSLMSSEVITKQITETHPILKEVDLNKLTEFSSNDAVLDLRVAQKRTAAWPSLTP